METDMIMILWMTASCALVALLISFSTVYYWRPAQIVKLLIWSMFKLRRAKVKYFEHEGYKFCYFSRGKPGPQPSILMFHGFSLAKDMWLPIMKYVPKDIHVICVDLPGHGGTSRLPEESYTGIEQAKRMHQFVEYSGLNKKPFHLVGISMGGMVAGLYAALYPSDIHCLSLLCPAGLRYPTDNDFVKRLKEMEKRKDFTAIPLIPVTIKQSEEMFKLTLYHSQKNTSKQLLQGFLDYRKPHVPFFTKCFLDFSSMESRHSLQDHISKITAPTQVIWGKHDQVLDPIGGKIFADAIPSCQVHMLEKCGHFIVVDRPKKSIKLILEFHASACGIKKNK
ncbi:monoacylglycerol lipase ABHD6-like [Heteronotia binoei]|uniref:monoacylglycerol lipase ABHD6-like n=1 Tax=Heteronotia binoei TaxID=13085 RepID=UPI00292CDA82|nr:monoacylglycerol lipase ABHD6-like [Heteronotia binoei]